jgi:transposase InsO family protein
MADGHSSLGILGSTSMPVKVHDIKFMFDMLVIDMDNMDGLWGMDFMAKFGCDLRMSNFTYTFQGVEYPINTNRHNLLPHSVSLASDLVLPPGAEVVLFAHLNSPFRTAQYALLEPSVHFVSKHGVLPAKSLSRQSRKQRRTPIQIFNPMNEEVIVPRGAVVGYMFPAEPMSDEKATPENEVQDDPPQSCTFTESQMTPQLEDLEHRMPDHLIELYRKSSANLKEDQKIKLASLLISFSSTFSASSSDIGHTNVISHQIDTGKAKPVRLPLRRVGYKKEKEIRAAVQDGLARGIMEESSSPWASAPVIVTKKDGTARFCVDFRKLNSITKVDGYPLPRFDECIDSLHGSKFFCTLDLQSGYWQVPLHSQQDMEKTAFLTKDGLFHFKVLPFGLCNAPATFERLMENVLRGLQWEKCLLYLDDILIFGRTFEETLESLKQVITRLEHANLKIKPSKCYLMQSELQFLGHIFSQEGIHPLSDKLLTVQSWPNLAAVPTSKLRTEVKRFLGLVGYYRRFIRNMSSIAAPLYRLTKKDCKPVWTEECQTSFKRLKAALTSAPVLSYPDPKGGNFILDTDASNTGTGGVLSQIQNGREVVIGYHSKLLSDSERKYCITKREFLGVIRAIGHFKPYLYGHRFLIRTDNSAVSHMLSLTDANEQIQRWQLFMSQFTYDIIHRPGRKHVNADYMSRLPCPQCGREEDTNNQTTLKPSRVRRVQIKESTDVPPCKHTKIENTRLEGDVDELMMRCSAVTTRSQSRRFAAEQSKDSNNKLDIQPQHKDPSKIPTPTQHVHTAPPDVNQEGLVQLNDLANIQKCDPDISPILQLKLAGSDYPDYRTISSESLSVKVLRQHWRHLFVMNGILYRKLEVPNKDTRTQLVLPRCVRQAIMEKMHADPVAGHLGIAKTLDKIKQRFYWVGWRRDVTRFVSHCATCNIIKRPHRKNKVPLTQQLFGEAFERVCIDIVGPLRETVRGYKYVLTMEDCFTKWVEATPLRTLETEEICNSIIREFISRFGCMYVLHSDRGPQFVSQLYAALLKKLGIDKSLTTPYNPKSNGLIENFNKIMKSMMKTYVQDHRQSVGDWDIMLPIFLMAYRSSLHTSTGETPHFMLTAREMKLPIDLLYTPPSENTQYVPRYVTELETRFNKAYAIVRDNLKLVQRVQKKQYETAHPKYQALKPGDFVWYFNPRKCFKGDKHLPWLGPYLVKSVNHDLTATLQIDQRDTLQRTHCDKLRLANGMTMEKWRMASK